MYLVNQYKKNYKNNIVDHTSNEIQLKQFNIL